VITGLTSSVRGSAFRKGRELERDKGRRNISSRARKHGGRQSTYRYNRWSVGWYTVRHSCCTGCPYSRDSLHDGGGGGGGGGGKRQHTCARHSDAHPTMTDVEGREAEGGG
jgi:hypothetical protein